VLLLGRDVNDPFFLQVKEANASVVDLARGRTSTLSEGERVVRNQRMMQATPDVFLGWHNIAGLDDVNRSYYVRQLYDNKASVNIDRLNATTLATYGRVCGWTLARAHARSGQSGRIAGYLGKGSTFDDAIVSYALAYESRSASDYELLRVAATQGRIPTA
jgi:hypothetical protein